MAEARRPEASLAVPDRPWAVVIRLSALGDVLLTAPFLQALGRTHRVAVVTTPAYVELVAALPGVSRAVGLERAAGLRGAWRLGRALRALQPERTWDLQSKARSWVLARAAGGQTRTLHRRTAGQAAAALLGRDPVQRAPHQTLRYLATLPGAPPAEPVTLPLAPAWQEAAAAFRERHQLTEPPVALAPVATHATKGWALGRFAEAVRAASTPQRPVLVLGSPGQLEPAERLRSLLPAHRVIDTSALPLTTLAAVLAGCRWLLANDTGPVHLATLVGTPTVTLFGPTAVERWGPWPAQPERHRVARLELPCAPCSNHGGAHCPLGHHRCMQDLTAAAAAREVAALGG